MENNNQIEGNWGVHINHKKNTSYPPIPEWLRGNKTFWAERGVIVWDKSANRVKCLLPQQALDVLDDLREWVEPGDKSFCLDWDAYRLPFSEEDRIAWRKTKNRRNLSPGRYSSSGSLTLSPEQARELLRFLEEHQTEIREVGEVHEKEASMAIARALALFARHGRKLRIKDQKSP